MIVERLNDLSDENVELSGGIKNKADGYVGRAHHVAPSPPVIIAVVVDATALQSVGDYGYPPSESSFAALR